MPRFMPFLLAAAALLAAPALATDKGLGLITQNNVAAMVVDLNPSYAGVPIEGSNGMLADNAITRYRTGRVKPLLPLSANPNLGAVTSGSGAAPVQPGGPR